jgi:hypothetical protein
MRNRPLLQNMNGSSFGYLFPNAEQRRRVDVLLTSSPKTENRKLSSAASTPPHTAYGFFLFSSPYDDAVSPAFTF